MQHVEGPVPITVYKACVEAILLGMETSGDQGRTSKRDAVHCSNLWVAIGVARVSLYEKLETDSDTHVVFTRACNRFQMGSKISSVPGTAEEMVMTDEIRATGVGRTHAAPSSGRTAGSLNVFHILNGFESRLLNILKQHR